MQANNELIQPESTDVFKKRPSKKLSAACLSAGVLLIAFEAIEQELAIQSIAVGLAAGTLGGVVSILARRYYSWLNALLGFIPIGFYKAFGPGGNMSWNLFSQFIGGILVSMALVGLLDIYEARRALTVGGVEKKT